MKPHPSGDDVSVFLALSAMEAEAAESKRQNKQGYDDGWRFVMNKGKGTKPEYDSRLAYREGFERGVAEAVAWAGEQAGLTAEGTIESALNPEFLSAF